jgi:hypothetical protein
VNDSSRILNHSHRLRDYMAWVTVDCRTKRMANDEVTVWRLNSDEEVEKKNAVEVSNFS